MPGIAHAGGKVHGAGLTQAGRQAHVGGDKGTRQKIDPVVLDVGTIRRG
jgi:hypothetical protein